MAHIEGPAVRRINLTVALCLLVYAFLLCVDVFLVIIPWLSYSVPGVSNLLLLSVEAGVGLYLYLCCVFYDPGRCGMYTHASYVDVSGFACVFARHALYTLDILVHPVRLLTHCY